MNRFIALLRGINVGGHRKIKMEKLRKLFGEWGFENVSTYIQSGNIAFDTPKNDPEFLSQKIKEHFMDSLEYDVPVLIRTVPELKKVIDQNPFPGIEPGKTTKLYVTFLSDEPEKEKADSLLSYQNDAERFKIIGRELYVLIHKDKTDKPVFSNNFVEKELGLSCTNRNWRSVNKIYEMGLQ